MQEGNSWQLEKIPILRAEFMINCCPSLQRDGHRPGWSLYCTKCKWEGLKAFHRPWHVVAACTKHRPAQSLSWCSLSLCYWRTNSPPSLPHAHPLNCVGVNTTRYEVQLTIKTQARQISIRCQELQPELHCAPLNSLPLSSSPSWGWGIAPGPPARPPVDRMPCSSPHPPLLPSLTGSSAASPLRWPRPSSCWPSCASVAGASFPWPPARLRSAAPR